MVMLIDACSCVLDAINAAVVSEEVLAPGLGPWDVRAQPERRIFTCVGLWLVRLSACRSPGYGGPEGSHACASCPASTSRKKTRAVPRGGRAAARLHRQPIPRALTTPPGGTLKRGIAVQETGRRGGAGGSVVTGARLDVRDLAQIPGGHLCAGLPKVLSTVVSRRCEGTHRTPRSSSSPAIRRPAGPGPPPAAPVTSTSPLARALPGVPRRLARQHYNQ